MQPKLKQPPADVPASELFLKLLETPPSEVVDFPRKGPDGQPVGRVRIMVLGQEDHDRARMNAYATLKKKGFDSEDLKDVGMREVVGDQIAKELMVMACHEEKPQEFTDKNGNPVYAKVFMRPEDVAKLRPHELGVLFNAYLLVQDKYGPREHEVDVDAWVNRLAEGGQSYPLLSLDLPELVSLSCSLAERVSTMCLALGTQWSALPSTCQSDLEPFCSGIASWREQQGEQLESSSTPKGHDVDITIDSAVELERRTSAIDRVHDMMQEE